MRITVTGDIHGSIANLKRLRNKLKKSDLIFITGDITGTISYSLVVKSIIKSRRISREKYVELVFNEYYHEFLKYQLSSAKKIFEILLKLNKPIFFTHGNSDTKEVREYFSQVSKENPSIYYVGNDVQLFEKWLVAGYGYCSPSKYRIPFATPGEKRDEDITKDLNRLEQKIAFFAENYSSTVIGLFHEPPLGSKLDYITHKSVHGGSELIRKHIQKIPYDYVFAGHIHESQNYEQFDNSILINPGSLINGKWASILHDTKSVNLRKMFFSLTVKGFAYKSRYILK